MSARHHGTNPARRAIAQSRTVIAPEAALDAIGGLPDSEIDIANAALQLARIDAPGLDWHGVTAFLSDLATDIVRLSAFVPPADTAGRAAALTSIIADQRGFAGDRDTYDDLANVNLIRVVQRRRGMPVALGIIWLHTAHAAGWAAHGIDFPGHFLVSLPAGSPGNGNLILDVFAGGAPLGAPDLRALLKRLEGGDAELRPGVLRPLSSRAVLLRLQNNIVLRRLRAGDLPGALICVENMLRFAPLESALWREAALINQRLDRNAAAVRCFEQFLVLVPAGDTASRTRAAIAELKSRLH